MFVVYFEIKTPPYFPRLFVVFASHIRNRKLISARARSHHQNSRLEWQFPAAVMTAPDWSKWASRPNKWISGARSVCFHSVRVNYNPMKFDSARHNTHTHTGDVNRGGPCMWAYMRGQPVFLFSHHSPPLSKSLMVFICALITSNNSSPSYLGARRDGRKKSEITIGFLMRIVVEEVTHHTDTHVCVCIILYGRRR